MVRKQARRSRKGAKRRGLRRNRRAAGRRLANSEFASMKQTISMPNDQNNIVYRLDDINLSLFDRATAVAKAYQYYRISKVEMAFKPFIDTFTSTGSQSVPYLHYLIMKGDNIDAGTFNQLRDAGSKPIRFDDKTVRVAWRPGVQQAVIGEDQVIPGPVPYTNFGLTRISPWLATNYNPAEQGLAWTPSKVPHRGLLYGVQEDYSVATQYYDVSITVHFQFKKPNPNMNPLPSGVAATPKVIEKKPEVVPATLAP